MKVVVIGGGATGISTATHLRRRNEETEIVILEKKQELGVSFCALPYLLGGLIPHSEDICGASVSQMQQIFNVDVKLGHEVIDIDRKNKILTLNEQAPVSYDKLVLATGAVQLRPDIDGVLGDNIFTLRDIAGVEKIRAYFSDTGVRNVLILGGGEMALATAEAFMHLGAHISLVEEAPQILPDFDAGMTKRLENQLRKFGVKLYLGRKVAGFYDTYAKLDNETLVKYDLAVIATGARPDVKLPIMADISLGLSGGILVNEHMQTNDPDIFAAGANVECNDAVTGKAERRTSAPLAVRQANVIADFLCGRSAAIKAEISCGIARIFGYTAAFAGNGEKQLQQAGIPFKYLYLLQNSNDIYMPGSEQMLFKLLFAADGKILGIQGLGTNGIQARVNAVAALMQKGGRVDDLCRFPVPYAPPYACPKDALNNLGSLAAAVLRGELQYYDAEAPDADKDIFLTDVRRPEHFDIRHLPGAVNIPLTTVRKQLSVFPRDKKIVLYCNDGYGAYLAYCILRGHNYDNVYLLNTPSDLSMDL